MRLVTDNPEHWETVLDQLEELLWMELKEAPPEDTASTDGEGNEIESKYTEDYNNVKPF